MSASLEVTRAMQDVRRAKLALAQAVERLIAELPEDVANEIHYNGQHAKVSGDYAPVLKLIMEIRHG